MIFCRTEIQKKRTGEQKMLQKSQKKQQGNKKSYRNRKNRYWKSKKLTGEQKNEAGHVLKGKSVCPFLKCLFKFCINQRKM
jgi:hypothetical protein